MSDIKTAYGSPAAVTITLASLPTSADLLTGQESAAIDNSAALALDYEVSGKITVGTTPTSGKAIEIYAVALRDDTPTWPDVFAGADAGRTVSSLATKDAACVLLARIGGILATANLAYTFGVRSVAAAFGGLIPKKFSLFVVHNTGDNLHATAGNHALTVRPRNETIV